MESVQSDLITVQVVFCGEHIPHAQLRPGDTSTHKLQGFKKFEQFLGLDPQATTMQALVDQLRARRDFNDNALTKGNGPVRLLLFPHYKDMVRDARPLYDSDAKCPARLREQTITQVMKELDSSFILDKEFLELHCEIIVQKSLNKGQQVGLQEQMVLDTEPEQQTETNSGLRLQVAVTSPTHTGRRQSRCVRKALQNNSYVSPEGVKHAQEESKDEPQKKVSASLNREEVEDDEGVKKPMVALEQYPPKKASSVFTGYADDSSSEDSDDRFNARPSLPQRRNPIQPSFDVTIQKNLEGGVSEISEGRLQFVQNEGFKISDDSGIIHKLMWADSKDFEFDDAAKSISLEKQSEIVLQFENGHAYSQFKELHNLRAPRQNPFLDFRGKVVERQPTLVNLETTEQESLCVFEIYKFKSRIFSESNWVKHHLILEKYEVTDSQMQENQIELWQVQMISDKHKITNKLPEEIFLLNAVEQIVVSTEQPMPHKLEDTAAKGKSIMKQSRLSMKLGDLVTIVFRDHTKNPIQIIFESKELCKQFTQSVQKILRTMWPENAKQFIIHQTHGFKPPTEKLRQRYLTHRDLDPENHVLIRKISQTMRQNHTSIDIGKDFDFHASQETGVEWVMNGQKQQIRFKTKMFRFGTTLLPNHEIAAEIADPVIFRMVIAVAKQTEEGSFFKKAKAKSNLVMTFTRDTVRGLDLSLVDNRSLKLQIKDLLQKKYIDYTIIFSNIHKRQQFVQLFQMEKPKSLALNQINQGQIVTQPPTTEDFKIFMMTWNMGQTDQTVFKDSPESIFGDISEYDLVMVCAQECKRLYTQKFWKELEEFFAINGFQLINGFEDMWEMWLGCFIKAKHYSSVTKFTSAQLAKGYGRLNTGKSHAFGNKGGVATSFMVYNRLFNVIAVHLKHDFENYEKRNKMASQLIKGIKMQQLEKTLRGLEGDQLADFAVFMGDTNYRLENSDLTDESELTDKAHTGYDQLHCAMKSGHFPDYHEPTICFMPTYPVHRTQFKQYLNRKKIAYTDRILFKNNSNFELEEMTYNGLHDVLGSDHRPVVRALSIKNWSQPQFAIASKLLDPSSPVLGFGRLDIQLIDALWLDFSKIGMVTKFDFNEMTSDIWLRISFFDANIDTQTSPIIYSQTIMVPANTKSKVQAQWTNDQLPCLHGASNTLELARQGRLLMFIWACGPAQNFPDEEMLIGCSNIKLGRLREDEEGVCKLEETLNVSVSNLQVGEVKVKLNYRNI